MDICTVFCTHTDVLDLVFMTILSYYMKVYCTQCTCFFTTLSNSLYLLFSNLFFGNFLHSLYIYIPPPPQAWSHLVSCRDNRYSTKLPFTKRPSTKRPVTKRPSTKRPRLQNINEYLENRIIIIQEIDDCY
jgi:hypothetical protein